MTPHKFFLFAIFTCAICAFVFATYVSLIASLRERKRMERTIDKMRQNTIGQALIAKEMIDYGQARFSSQHKEQFR